MCIRDSHQLVKNVEVEIGGQRIDKHYGEWLHLWNELSQSPGLQSGYARMTGNVGSLVSNGNKDKTTLYIPLQFWFCRNPGLALPLIALQYHEVKINVEFNDLAKCAKAGSTLNNSSLTLGSTSLFVDYIYLDTDERRRFAQVSHEYLIEQLQFTGEESVSSVNNKVKLNFNHPVKELVWVVQHNECVANNQYFNFTDAVDQIDGEVLTGSPSDPLGEGLVGADGSSIASIVGQGTDEGVNSVSMAKLQLNGHDRFQEREGDYFNFVQPYQHHTNVPALGVNVYSFGLKPEEHQPSGTCNFSRIDNAVLQMSVTTQAAGTAGLNTTNATGSKVRVYATNYNVLRIMSGMGGLAYSN